MSGKFIKKVLGVTLGSSLIFGALGGVVGASPVQEGYESVVLDDNSDKISYEVNGITLNSEIELTQEQLESVYNISMSNPAIANNSNVTIDFGASNITPYGQIIGETGTVIAGPLYQTHSNFGAKLVADAMISYIAAKTKIFSFASKSGAALWALGVAQSWGLDNVIKPTYTGMWTTRSFNNYTGQYHYYLNLVYYTNNSYITPINVQYGEQWRSYEKIDSL